VDGVDSMNEQVEILSFAECQTYFKHVNEDLYNLLTEVIPPTLACFVKVNYQYGDLIINQGQLQLSKYPFLGLDAVTMDKITAELSYCAIPLGYIVENIAEVFIEENEYPSPLNLISAGKMFGLFETVDYLQDIKTSPIWMVSAGTRNIFTLAKISDRKKLIKLGKSLGFQLKDKFTQFSSHWQLFRTITQATHSTWRCPVIFFGKSFFDHIEKANVGHTLKAYLYQLAWTQVAHFIVDFDLKVMWRSMLDKLAMRNYSPNPYISHQIKHLFILSMGRLPGFMPVNEDFKGAPISQIQEALHTFYQTKHWPTLISTVPTDTLAQTGKVFYSLSYPSLLEGLPVNRARYTLLDDLRQIQSLTTIVWKHIQKEVGSIKNIQFDFIHPDAISTDNMHSIADVISQQPLFSQQMGTVNTASTFWRGCICIQKRQPE
jgi:hypothetical protein